MSERVRNNLFNKIVTASAVLLKLNIDKVIRFHFIPFYYSMTREKNKLDTVMKRLAQIYSTCLKAVRILHTGVHQYMSLDQWQR